MKKQAEAWLIAAEDDLAVIEEILTNVYTHARYPGDIGLLPYGKPSPEDAAAFFRQAQDIFNTIRRHLERTTG